VETGGDEVSRRRREVLSAALSKNGGEKWPDSPGTCGGLEAPYR
jgi:hypothetical protein